MYIIGRGSGNGNLTRLRRMFELSMTATLSRLSPAIIFNQLDELAYLHQFEAMCRS